MLLHLPQALVTKYHTTSIRNLGFPEKCCALSSTSTIPSDRKTWPPPPTHTQKPLFWLLLIEPYTASLQKNAPVFHMTPPHSPRVRKTSVCIVLPIVSSTRPSRQQNSSSRLVSLLMTPTLHHSLEYGPFSPSLGGSVGFIRCKSLDIVFSGTSRLYEVG